MKVPVDLTTRETMARERTLFRRAIARAESDLGLPVDAIPRDVLMVYWAAECAAADEQAAK